MPPTTTEPDIGVHEVFPKTVHHVPEPQAEDTFLETSKTVIKHGLTAADAQLSMWSYKAIQWALLMLFMVPFILVFIGFSIYGFILLDRAFDLALLSTNNPLWFSPLIRGGVYGAVAIAGISMLWNAIKPESDDSIEAREENHHV